MEKTLAIIKPDAVQNKNIGKIVDRIEEEGFEILGLKMLNLQVEQVEEFYAVHKEKPFFGEATQFMASGPIIVIALQKENAVKVWRNLMGATNPEQADEGTLRKLYGTSIGNNAVHGSDSLENAEKEVAFFFPELN
ncbi:nucleoside-diphosphate kinase [Candidatus Babeliales bacterium]|nr:nucleoside-diphosphate kinase [Candidatus Babeliales bacterium]